MHTPSSTLHAPADGRAIPDNLLDAADRVLPVEREQLEEWQRQAEDIDRKAKHYIRANPTTTIVVAVAAGFVLGRLLAR